MAAIDIIEDWAGEDLFMDLRSGEGEILVGAPSWNREWILPSWREHVLRAAEVASLKVSFLLAVQENTPDWQFCEDLGIETVLTEEPEQDRGRRNWGPDRYNHMVYLRNSMLERVRKHGPEFFLSLDTDILLHPKAIMNIMDCIYRFDAVAAKCYMTPRGTSAPNHGTYLNGAGLLQDDVFDVVETEIIMAAKLMRETAYHVDYEYHSMGEDIGYCLAAKRKGLRFAIDGRVTSRHCMNEDIWKNGDARCDC